MSVQLTQWRIEPGAGVVPRGSLKADPWSARQVWVEAGASRSLAIRAACERAGTQPRAEHLRPLLSRGL